MAQVGPMQKQTASHRSTYSAMVSWKYNIGYSVSVINSCLIREHWYFSIWFKQSFLSFRTDFTLFLRLAVPSLIPDPDLDHNSPFHSNNVERTLGTHKLSSVHL